jgi:4-hydroxybenzoate polyprenyltransferase
MFLKRSMRISTFDRLNVPTRPDVLQSLRDFLGMIRFSHTVFALPFALLSAVLAWQDVPIQWPHIVGILACMVLARSAAMAFNRLADRKLDSQNPRTAGRHLVTGQLSARSVLVFTVVCSLGFIASTAIFLLNDPSNPWPLILSIPLLIFICAYSLTKRFTSLAHFWLGASLMLAPISAWIAIRGPFEMLTPLAIGVAVFFWVSGFDILYACQDIDFDRRAKLHSVPARFGVKGSLRIALLCHFVMLLALFALYFVSPHLGWIYLAGLAAITIFVFYEHWLVSPNDLSRVNRAFFQVNGVISVGLLLIVLVQVLVKV